MTPPIALEIFADYVCPWCYLGNAVAEKLQQQFPLRLTRTPFPLHPATPQEGLLLSELLRGADLDSVHQRLYALMDDLGLPYGKRDKTFNSRLAQELGLWADTQAGGEALHGLLYRRYFVQNQNLAEKDVLLSVVTEAGLDVEAARISLDERSYSGAVDDAWERARGFRITGVPTFVAGGYQVSGFQPLNEMQKFIQFVQEKTTLYAPTMTFVSFDMLRTIGFPDTVQLKPPQMAAHAQALRDAHCVLYPEYWQLNVLLYAYQARVFPSEATYRIGHNKIEMTRAFEAVAPHNIPDTQIRANTPMHAEELWHMLTLPFVAKLPRSSQGEGVWLIQSHSDWQRYLQKTDVLYVQEYLPIDRDLRIVLVGDSILAAYWRIQSPYSFHNNVARGGDIDTQSPVPQAALDLVLDVSRKLGIDHAGFDVAMVGERPYLFELNRLFGNKGIEGGDARIGNAALAYLERKNLERTNLERKNLERQSLEHHRR